MLPTASERTEIANLDQKKINRYKKLNIICFVYQPLYFVYSFMNVIWFDLGIHRRIWHKILHLFGKVFSKEKDYI